MANSLLGWINQFTLGAITGGPSEALLPVANLSGVTGSPSSAWQTPAGVTAGAVVVDSGSPTTVWQAFGLFRSNLTPSAQIRWRVGTAASLVDPPTDFDVDFTGGAANLPTAWSFSRASVASYCSGAQSLAAVASGAPRFDHDFISGVPLGLLVEEPRTNVMPNSASMSGNTNGSSDSTITNPSTDVGSLMTGQNVAKCVMANTDASVTIASRIALGTLTASVTYLASIYVYVPSTGTAVTGLTITLTGTGMATAAQLIAYDNTKLDQWQRVSARLTVGTTTTGGILALNTSGTAGRTVYTSCWQMEVVTAAEVSGSLYFSTSYIPTTSTTAVARVAEVATITVPTGAAISGGVDTILNSHNGAVQALVGMSASYYINTGAANGAVWNMITASGNVNGPSAGTVVGQRTRVSWGADSSGGSISQDGTFGTNSSGAANTAATTTIQIGNKSGATLYYNGTIQRLRIYPQRLTDPALNELSGPTNSPTTGSTYDSGLVSAGVQAGYAKTVLALDAPVVGQVVRFDISDPSNPDGFINIPLAFAGPVFQPMTNIDYSTTIGRDSQIDETVTRGGQELPIARWSRLRVELSFNGLRTAEVWPTIMEIDRVSRLTGNIIFVNDPDNGLAGYETVFGRLTPTSDLTYPYGNADRRSWKARVQERL